MVLYLLSFRPIILTTTHSLDILLPCWIYLPSHRLSLELEIPQQLAPIPQVSQAILYSCFDIILIPSQFPRYLLRNWSHPSCQRCQLRPLGNRWFRFPIPYTQASFLVVDKVQLCALCRARCWCSRFCGPHFLHSAISTQRDYWGQQYSDLVG